MPMRGIEPLSDAYETPALPLSYTGSINKKYVAGAGIEPATSGL